MNMNWTSFFITPDGSTETDITAVKNDKYTKHRKIIVCPMLCMDRI